MLVAGAGLRDDGADACGWEGPTIEDLTTFDPKVIGEPWDGLYFDPFTAGYGGACDDCSARAVLDDWAGYVGDGTPPAELQRLVFDAPAAELDALAAAIAGRGGPPPGYGGTTWWSKPGARARLGAGLKLLSLVRRLAPHAALITDGPPAPPPPPALLAEAQAGLRSARDPFLAQRYAFQVLRAQFYRRAWGAAVAFHDQHQAVLAGPSKDLQWRARYYLAGALQYDKKLGRANLELARVASYQPLAGAAAQDFRPQEDADWRETLRLARDARERTLLWRLVGVKQDGLVAIREIQKLDPKSDLLALLFVRELARAESKVQAGSKPTPAEAAAQRKTYAALEQLAIAQAAVPGGDRPWLMDLVAGHIAAKRGDVAAAKARLERAAAGKKSPQVASQVSASLALALAVDWKLNPAREGELAAAMRAIDPNFERLSSVRSEVRNTLAAAYAKAGRFIDAEFLRPGLVMEPGARPGPPAWQDTGFIKQMIARAGQQSTAFERFVLDGSYKQPDLEAELALRYLVEGDFAASAKVFSSTRATSTKLGTDPFAMRIVDCHDCDHQRFVNAPWTHATFASRLAELARAAAGTGEPAAEASLTLGIALYNTTHYGNARIVLDGSHQTQRDTRLAERWLKRAFDLSRNRELKAKAAFQAAKAELGGLISKHLEANPNTYGDLDQLPIPTTWFPALKTLNDTRYYREVLRECGHFATWATAGLPPPRRHR